LKKKSPTYIINTLQKKLTTSAHFSLTQEVLTELKTFVLLSQVHLQC